MKRLLILIVALFGIHAQALSYNPVHVSSAHTMAASEDLVLLGGSSIFAVTMEACGNSNDGATHIFRGISSLVHCVSVAAATGDSMESAGSNTVCAYQAMQISCDGPNRNWVDIGYW